MIPWARAVLAAAPVSGRPLRAIVMRSCPTFGMRVYKVAYPPTRYTISTTPTRLSSPFFIFFSLLLPTFTKKKKEYIKMAQLAAFKIPEIHNEPMVSRLPPRLERLEPGRH